MATRKRALNAPPLDPLAPDVDAGGALLADDSPPEMPSGDTAADTSIYQWSTPDAVLPDWVRPEGDIGQDFYVPDWVNGADPRLAPQWEQACQTGAILDGVLAGLDRDTDPATVIIALPGLWRGLCPLPAFDPHATPRQVIGRLGLHTQFTVLAVDPALGVVVVSRMEALTKLRAAMADRLQEGRLVTGVVRFVNEAGAICDLGGITGYLPRHYMGIIPEDGTVPALIPRGAKLHLGIRHITPDGRITLDAVMPYRAAWDRLTGSLKVHQVCSGTVTRVRPGAVVVALQTPAGVPVVIRAPRPADIAVGDRVRVRIQSINSSTRTIVGRLLSRIAGGV